MRCLFPFRAADVVVRAGRQFEDAPCHWRRYALLRDHVEAARAQVPLRFQDGREALGLQRHVSGADAQGENGKLSVVRFNNGLPQNDSVGIGHPINCIHRHGACRRRKTTASRSTSSIPGRRATSSGRTWKRPRCGITITRSISQQRMSIVVLPASISCSTRRTANAASSIQIRMPSGCPGALRPMGRAAFMIFRSCFRIAVHVDRAAGL